MIVGGHIGRTNYSIEDLWVRVKQRFAENADLASILFYEGPQYLKQSSKGNRIVFVQDDPEIVFGGMRSGAEEIGLLTDACKAHVWGVEQDRDYRLDQAIATKGLAVDLLAAAYLSFPGMVTGGVIAVSSDTHVLKYGEHFVVSIRLRCPVEKVTSEVALHIGGAETGIIRGRHSAS